MISIDGKKHRSNGVKTVKKSRSEGIISLLSGYYARSVKFFHVIGVQQRSIAKMGKKE